MKSRIALFFVVVALILPGISCQMQSQHIEIPKAARGVLDVEYDQNKNGLPDYEELDFDGDGFDRAKSVPWDVFPFDRNEWRDTDGGGIGDNADADDDNDGFDDQQELRKGTNPLDKLSFPA